MRARTKALMEVVLALLVVAGFSCGEGPSGERPPAKPATTPARQAEPKASTARPASVQQSAAEADTAAMDAATTATVYYFHTTFRCRTCNLMESLTKEAVEEDFSQQMESGRVVFKAVNVDEKQNRHFVKRYKLHTKSVIVSTSDGEREKDWKNLDQIWTKVRGAHEGFKQYISNGVREALR
jgi:hypothetical protein